MNNIPYLPHTIAIVWLLIVWFQWRREPKPEVIKPQFIQPKLITKNGVYYDK